MAKKQKKATPERAPTKHQLSRWQRQMRIRRIVIIAAVVFLVGILSYVGYGYYQDYKSDPWREVVIEVNGVHFTMEYFVKVLDDYFYIGGLNSTEIYYMGDAVANDIANDIIKTEVLSQGAENLGIKVTSKEIDAEISAQNISEEAVQLYKEAFRNMFKSFLLQEKLRKYFGSQLPDKMEQARVQVMLVESQEVADEVTSRIGAGGNFTALAEEFSCNSSIEGDLGWLPRELMPNTLISDAAFNITPGEIKIIYDETAIKDTGTTGGYWVVQVLDSGERELEEEVKEELINKRFNDSFEEWKESSVIENRLDEVKRAWVISKILEGRQQ